MSKFIKVTTHGTSNSLLIAACNITSIGNEEVCTVYTKDGFIKVNETIEQIEAQLLRDEFAMAAMNGLLASGEKISKENTGMYSRHAAQLAHKAGVYADAMLKERLK